MIIFSNDRVSAIEGAIEEGMTSKGLSPIVHLLTY